MRSDAERLQALADNGHGDLAAAAQDLALNQHERQLRACWQCRTIRVEQIEISNLDAIAKACPQLGGSVLGDVAPGIFHALSACDGYADDVYRECCHDPQHPLLPQPHVGLEEGRPPPSLP